MNDSEKDASIEYILSQGLVKPQSIRNLINEMFHVVGLRYIFWDMSQAILIALSATAAVIILASLRNPVIVGQQGYSTVFTLAPVLFIFTEFSSVLMERVEGIYELKMTLKYTAKQVTAFRTLCFSLIGVVFSVTITAVFGQAVGIYSFFDMLSLSLLSLFLYALLMTVVARRLPKSWFLTVLFWICLSVFPMLLIGEEEWNVILSRLPGIASFAAAVGVCVLYLLEIKKMINTKGEIDYVIG